MFSSVTRNCPSRIQPHILTSEVDKILSHRAEHQSRHKIKSQLTGGAFRRSFDSIPSLTKLVATISRPATSGVLKYQFLVFLELNSCHYPPPLTFTTVKIASISPIACHHIFCAFILANSHRLDGLSNAEVRVTGQMLVNSTRRGL